MVLGENRAVLQDGVGHAVVVLLAVGEAVAGEEGLVHLQPHAVGVNEGAVQVKKQHRGPPYSSSQNRQGKSTASGA